ncbi:hypothetical protein M378DRAFT_185909 [Amanita muscaria Koide BX008]|uniref:Kinesin-like protein n=1 Tax=Amanita muscaria (strain Koide BX008) TaxID=946122 RepID=A0A0C2WYJ9_AMAMK|nr:hypothetical protein M378DRAFT_185909 [Amanita muscaria Koide BX008]
MTLPTTTPQVSRIARPRPSSSLSFATPAKGPPGSVSYSRSQSSLSSVPPTPITNGGKYKAALSTESKPRNIHFPRSKTPLPTVPGSPKTPSRPNSRTGKRPESVCSGAGTWGRTTPSLPLFGTTQLSEMDVSNVDPEDVLVDSHTVEPGDVSGELALDILDSADPPDVDDEGANNAGKHDKVMVSVRIKGSSPSSANAGNGGSKQQHCHAGAWTYAPEMNTIMLNAAFAKHPQLFSSSSPSSLSPESPSSNSSNTGSSFAYDTVLTGRTNKPIYTRTARSHVLAAMEGYNAVVFAYGQTASGKTYTLSGDEEGGEPGIIPRAMRDVFATIKKTPDREYLLRCSYLEIYNETIFDLLAPPSSAAANPVQIQGSGSLLKGGNSDVILTPLREEVVTSLKGVKEVLRRGESNRRTACTDWNERSSRSHSVFRMVIESREKDESVAARQKRIEEEGEDKEDEESVAAALLNTSMGGRRTPGLASGRQTPAQLGGPRLQAKGGRSVRTSVLSLIDLAGSEKATSDKERTREGKYINTSLLTLGTVIGTLADNAGKKKSDYVPYRNSKLTRLLQPSLSGNARISVICTINPDAGAISETMSTLLFAKRIKNVKLNAQKKEVVDTEALIERYKKEIEDLKQRLAEREHEAEVHSPSRRLSTKEKADESKAMKDLNARIQQLTKLILTSQTVDEAKADESRPASPVKVDFDMSPYQLQQELLNTKNQIESQATQILALEEALLARPPLPTSASENEKDALITAQNKTIRELEIVVRGYEDNLGEPLRKVKEDVEREWIEKVEEEKRKKEEKGKWAEELVKQLDRERRTRQKLENERRALAAFVSKFDSLGLGMALSSPSGSAAASIATAAVALKTPTRTGGSVIKTSPVGDRNKLKKVDECEKENAVEGVSTCISASEIILPLSATPSPMKMDWLLRGQQHQLLQGPTMLLMEQMPEEVAWCGDLSFEVGAASPGKERDMREVFGGKENVV